MCMFLDFSSWLPEEVAQDLLMIPTIKESKYKIQLPEELGNFFTLMEKV